MSLEMVEVELLKLRRRRGLFWWSLFLTVGVPLVYFTIVRKRFEGPRVKLAALESK